MGCRLIAPVLCIYRFFVQKMFDSVYLSKFLVLSELLTSHREAAKKVPPLTAGPFRGGGGKGRAIKEKITF